MAFNWQAYTCHCHHPARRPGNTTGNFAALNRAACGCYTDTFIVFDIKTGDFTILDNINTKTARRPGIPPRHRIMPHRATTMLGKAALNWKAGIFSVQKGIAVFDLLCCQKIGVSPIQKHGIAAADRGITLGVGVKQVQNTALADHCIII